jgi:hypothetical protein
MTWHADATTLARYAGGAVDAVTAGSVEAHLTGCAECREALAPYADGARLDATWAGVVDRLDRPRATAAERALRALGVRDDRARLLAATPSLRTSWLLSVLLVVTFAMVAGWAEGDGLVFLLVAPLLPVAGVAAAYGPGVDAAYEVGVAAPFGGVRLLLLRSLAVLTFSVAVCGAAGLAVPGLGAAWLLPALALSAATLALTTVTTPAVAAAVASLAWLGWAFTRSGALAGARTQVGSALVLTVAVAVLAARFGRFETGEGA